MSTRWNSGRLASMIAMHWPRSRPSLARPPATASLRSRSWPQVHETSSSFVRTATSSARLAAVMRNASLKVAASMARRAAVGLSMRGVLPHVEAFARQSPDVVGEADDEDEEHQGDADRAGALHDAERDRPAAQLLGDRPEDVPAVERQEREEVDHRQRERDGGEQEQ